MPQFIGYFVKVKSCKQVVNGFGAHLCNELVWVTVIKVLVFSREVLNNVKVLFFSEKIHDVDIILLFNTRLDDHISFIINNCVELFGLKTQQGTNFIR